MASVRFNIFPARRVTAVSWRRPVVLLAALLAGLLTMAALRPGFPDAAELSALLAGAAPAVLLALGQALVLTAGGVDLSVGAVAQVAGVLAAVAARGAWPVWVALPLILAGAGGLGVGHGLVVTRLRLPSYLVTLASLAVLRGVLAAIGATTAPVALLAPGMAFGVALLAALAVGLAVHRGRAGVALFALGADAEAARLTGISPAWVGGVAYGMCALLAAVAGLVGAGAAPLSAVGSIAAGLLGGAGSVPGTVLAALLLSLGGSVGNPAVWGPVIAGAVIGGAVIGGAVIGGAVIGGAGIGGAGIGEAGPWQGGYPGGGHRQEAPTTRR